MEDSRPVKKRKSGGSFCAVGGCSNNSHRNQTSAIQGRGFLKYLNIPKDPKRTSDWTKRMNRQFGWKPSDHTKICSDHFHDNDFLQTDKYKENQNREKKTRHLLRWKKDAIPNTDRDNGQIFKDPLAPAIPQQRPPPKHRAQISQPPSPARAMVDMELGVEQMIDAETAVLGEDEGIEELFLLELFYQDVSLKRFVISIRKRTQKVTRALLSH